MPDTRLPSSVEASADVALGLADTGLEPLEPPRIVGLGVACLDYLFKAPHARAGGQAALADYAVEGGGLIATALVAAARLGAQTQLRTWIGDDDEGRLVLSGLEQDQVDTSAVTIVPGARTAVSFVHVTETTGERTIYHRRGPTPTYAQMSAAAALEGDYHAALVDGVWPEASLAFARQARTAGIPVVADFCPHERLRQLATAVDFLIVPRACAQRLVPDGDWIDRLRALRKLGPATAVITAGVEGCYYLDQDEMVHQPTFQVDVVDTTGAGDVFHGAFAYGLAARLPLRRCIQLASAVAALSCRALGGRPAIPTGKEVSEFLHQL